MIKYNWFFQIIHNVLQIYTLFKFHIKDLFVIDKLKKSFRPWLFLLSNVQILHCKIISWLFLGLFYKYSAIQILPDGLKYKARNLTANSFMACAGMCNAAFQDSARYLT